MKRVALFCCIILLAACTRNISPDTYSVGAVGQASRTMRGVIINVRDVKIEGNRSGVGAGAGALGGGVAGSAIGSGGRSNAIGAIGGAVVGGIAGAAIEEGSTRQMGIEYVVETENGNLLTVVQGEPRLDKGNKVLVIYGSPTRIIAAQ